MKHHCHLLLEAAVADNLSQSSRQWAGITSQ
jgi:hypothetical protein